MKRVLGFVFILCFSLTMIGQESDVPFRKCNTIKVVPHGETDNMMMQFASFLENEGFNIRRINEQKTNLRTAPFNMISNVQTNAIIHVMAPRKETEENYLYITAFAKPNEYGKSEYKMSDTNAKFTVNGMLFDKVNELASRFAGMYNYQLVYLKNKH